MNTPIDLLRATALLLALTGAAAGQPTLRAPLQPENERKPAPNFVLKDSSGKTVSLKKLHGKVVLLDFWATWCHGCKEEIPWFSEFEKTYRAKGLAVVGVSMDDGWSVVKSFLAETHVPYRIVLGNDETTKQYGIGNMPDAFLIDRHGKVAAAYMAGLVDKDDVEANIKAILSKR
jgi:peroxiredoxin